MYSKGLMFDEDEEFGIAPSKILLEIPQIFDQAIE